MLHFARRSLLIQLLSVYLLFILVVLIGGIEINIVVEQHLSADVQASDRALAQEIALNTSIQLNDAEHALIQLGGLVKTFGPQAQSASSFPSLENIFTTFQKARSDVFQVYWINPFGSILIACTPGQNVACNNLQYGEFSPPGVIQQVLQQARLSTTPAFEVGVAIDSASRQATLNAGVIIAEPVYTDNKELIGIVAANISLDKLSIPLEKVVQAQQKQGRQLEISIIDSGGDVVASPVHSQILLRMVNQMPGADQALQGNANSSLGRGPDGNDWLFSSVPVPIFGWAVVVERPASDALAVVNELHLWLLAAALLFAVGGLLFWLMLLGRVIQPLHILAIQHQKLPASEEAIPAHATVVAKRTDEVGDLARSLVRLERDGLEKLGELRTLLETSTAVVESLDPHAVVKKIIGEARRLVDVQAAAILLPDEQGVLRVLVSEEHSAHYDHTLSLSSANASSAAVIAMRDKKPVQKLLGPEEPSFSYYDGFRTVLAIPIISRHAGNVVLLVHRTKPQPFNQNEIDLLLTFANYATLAWEHAVLYERSDERLREVAQENEHLYRQASEEKQKLEAIMGSMSDGLVLTGIDGTVPYANAGASAILGLSSEALERHPISQLYDALLHSAVDHTVCKERLDQAQSLEATEIEVEIKRDEQRRTIHLRLFDVGDESGQVIGRGLLLRDVTREREIDEFKSTLLAAVGHELRTPLAAIKGHASTLLQQDVTWSPADQQHFLQTISGEADRLALLVSNLLDLSRQEAGLLLLNRAPVRLDDLVAKAIERQSYSSSVITSQIPDNLPPVNIDSARIEVVLNNLIGNAQTYGEGKVHITAEQKDGSAVISVSDNGPGIAPDELPHVFERFYRSQFGRQKHSGGTGIGLTICKAFIEAHGSTIWVESSPGGTTISFTLPFATPLKKDTSVAAADITTLEQLAQ